MTKSPAFQHYPNDFLGEVATYSLEEIGLYSVLLDHDWNLNGLPLEAEKLAKLARVSVRKFRALWRTVGERFLERDGRYYNARLEIERAKQAENRAKKVDAANSRWNADAHADAHAPAMHAQCLSTSSSSSLTEEQSIVHSADEDRLLAALPDDTTRMAWSAEIDAHRQGMHGKPMTEEQIGRACRQYVGNGHMANPNKPPTLRHFGGFLTTASRPPVVRTFTPKAAPSKQATARDELAAWAAGDSHGN